MRAVRFFPPPHLANSALTQPVLAFKVHFDGYGKGVFQGDRAPTEVMDMQRYYGLIQEHKGENLAKTETKY